LAAHYALNPTYVSIAKRFKGQKFVEKVYVELNYEKLRELIDYALDLLSFLEKYQNLREPDMALGKSHYHSIFLISLA